MKRNMFPILPLACVLAFFAQAAKPARPTTIPLKVTVNTQEQFSTPYGNLTAITPDGAGQYVDGQGGVCANINNLGDLIIDFACGSGSAQRQIGVNLATFLAPPPGGTNTCNAPLTLTPSQPAPYASHLGTAQAADQPSSEFGSMNVWSPSNPTANIYYVQMFIANKFSDAASTGWRLNYHYTLTGRANVLLASYAQVRRTSSTQWIVESIGPSGLSGAPSNVAMLLKDTSTKHSTTTTECGFYSAPFSFTLDQK